MEECRTAHGFDTHVVLGKCRRARLRLGCMLSVRGVAGPAGEQSGTAQAPPLNCNTTATDSQPPIAPLIRPTKYAQRSSRSAKAVAAGGPLNQPGVTIHGSCAPGYEQVRDVFETNFRERDEVGASVAVWVDGDLAVNLWGGSADAGAVSPWRDDTLASIFSGSKGLISTCIHLLADRGEIDLHSPVAEYWPEFGQAGKQDITVAMVMGHRSGVIGPRSRLLPEQTLDWDAV